MQSHQSLGAESCSFVVDRILGPKHKYKAASRKCLRPLCTTTHYIFGSSINSWEPSPQFFLENMLSVIKNNDSIYFKKRPRLHLVIRRALGDLDH